MRITRVFAVAGAGALTVPGLNEGEPKCEW
jgi:hypothetical protein